MHKFGLVVEEQLQLLRVWVALQEHVKRQKPHADDAPAGLQLPER